MKKGINYLVPFLAFLLCLFNTSKAWGYNYNCALTAVDVSHDSDNNEFTLTISIRGKNTAEYSKTTTYNSTLTLNLFQVTTLWKDLILLILKLIRLRMVPPQQAVLNLFTTQTPVIYMRAKHPHLSSIKRALIVILSE